MKKGLVFFSFLLILSNLFSQSFEWAAGMGGYGEDEGNSLTVDAAGNVYTVGTFEYTADFDPGAGVFELTSNGSTDIFISKLSASGMFMWAIQIGNSYYDFSRSIALDNNANVYITGGFSGTMDCDL